LSIANPTKRLGGRRPMGESTGIAWAESTWNPWRGCTKVSAGCERCYMFREQIRYGRNPEIITRSKTTFDAPLRWKEPRRIFTCSWSDWFHPAADEWRPAAWDVIQKTPQHTYLILTKRPEYARARLPADWGTGWPNVWIGVSGETIYQARKRGKILFYDVPAKVLFLSAEPWLERTHARAETWLGVVGPFDWVILGGESGPGARPMDEFTAKAMRDAAVLSDIPFFLKQLGGYPDARSHEKAVLDGRTWTEVPSV
jgi:protein gp37